MSDRTKERIVMVIAVLFLLAAGMLVKCAHAQTRAFDGADSAEKVYSALVTPIPQGQAIALNTPFKVAITTGTGIWFRRITPKPFKIVLSPVVENSSGSSNTGTPIEVFLVSAVSNDTLTLIGRAIGGVWTARTWNAGSYVSKRLLFQDLKELQDTVNWLLTNGPGTGTVTSIATSSPLRMNGSPGGSTTTSGTISIPQATSSQGGYLTMGDWSIFNGKQNTISAASPMTLIGATLGMTQASAIQSGYLSFTDWTTFNGKQNPLPDTTGKTNRVLSVLPTGSVDWSTSGSGTVTSVNVNGGTTGLTFSGGPITSTGSIVTSGTLSVANGGTGGTTAAQADVNLLPDTTGNTKKYLRVAAGGGFVWDTAAGGGGGGSGTVTSVAVSGGTTGLTTSGGPITTSGTVTIAGTLVVANGGTGATTLTSHGIVKANGTSALSTIAPSTSGNILTSNGTDWTSAAPATNGTVTSVALTLPAEFSVAGSPITTSGTFAVTRTSQAQNLVLASPDGSSGVPTYRALVVADLPALSTLTLSNTTNQLVLGMTNTTTISATAPAASSVYTIPDVGTSANFVMTQGTQTIAGQKTFSSNIIGSITGNSGTVTNGVYTIGTNTLTGAQNLEKDNIKTTYTTAATLKNATASDAVNTVQQSPSLLFDAHGWSTASTAADSELMVRITDVPVTAANATSKFNIDFGNAALGFTNQFSLTNAGVLTLGSPLPIASGGTGAATANNALNALLPSQGGNAGKVLTTDATNTSWTALSGVSVTSFNTRTGAVVPAAGDYTEVLGGTGQTSYTLGDLLYSSASNTLAKLAGNTTSTKKFLSQTGTGSVSAAPGWNTIAAGDVPTLNQNTTGSAAKWTTARNLAGNSVDGSANVAFSNAFVVQGTADAGLSSAQFLGALGTGIVKNTTTTGVLSIAVAGDFPTLNQNTTGSAATLTTPRAIYGNNFDGSAALAQIIASTYGGTGNGFTKFSGATTAEKTYTLPDASTTILTTNAAVTVAQGGTGLATLTANNVMLGNGTSNVQFVAPGTSGNTLQSNGTTWVSAAGGSGTVTSVATGSGLTGGTITTTGTLSLDLTSANVFTAAQTVNKAGIATTYTNGLVLQNTTASTSGVTVQQSPSLVWDARSWSTTSVATDSQSTVRMTLVPTSGVNPLTSHLILDVGTTNRGFAKALDWQLSNNTAQTGALIITANEMQIGSAANAGQITDLWLGYGKTGGGGYNATYHAGNGNGSNNPGANFFLQAGIGTGTQLGGEFDWISSFVGGGGSTLNTTRTLMTLVPSGTSGTTAKATLTLGVASSADASIVLKNLTNANTYTIAQVAPSGSRTLTIQDPAGAADILMATTNLSTAGHLAVTTATRGKLEDNANQGITQILTFANNGAAGRAIQISDASANDGDPLSLYAGNANGTDANGGQIVWNTGEGTGAGNGGQLTLQASFPGTTGTTLRARHTLMQVVPTGTLTSTALATLSLGETGGGTVGGALAFYRAADANTVTIKTATTASSETYTIQDAGAAADFLMSTTNLSTANQTVMTTSTRGNLKSAAANVLTGTPSNPTGTALATATMMGLGATATITPATTGAVTFVVSCNINSGATGSPVIQLRYGTGTAPVNGASATGTAVGFAAKETGLANGSIPATLIGTVTGLTAGTAYWFDVSLKSDGTSVASITDVYVQAVEIK